MKNRQQVADMLEQHLQNHAMRRGTAAFRRGLINTGVSDHLPIQSIITTARNQSINLLSWNMLADEHLYNNFRNVNGTREMIACMKKQFPHGHAYHDGKTNNMRKLFIDLSRYLAKQSRQSQVHVDERVLRSFISCDNAPSDAVTAENPQQRARQIAEVERARRAAVDILLDPTNPFAHEFQLGLQQSMELIHHIEHEQGALRWDNRAELLYQDDALIQQLAASDVICLQECTNPDDVAVLCEQAGKPMQMLTHKLPKHADDHCVLMFNPERFELVGEPVKGHLEGKKPVLFAKVRDKQSGELMVLGSVHHPGGKHSFLPEIKQYVDQLRAPPDSDIPYHIGGDFNHVNGFFAEQQSEASAQLRFPEQGTMSANDHGNLNKPIDAVLSSSEPAQIQVKTVDTLQMHAPAPMDKVPTLRFASFMQPVQQPPQPATATELSAFSKQKSDPSAVLHPNKTAVNENKASLAEPGIEAVSDRVRKNIGG